MLLAVSKEFAVKGLGRRRRCRKFYNHTEKHLAASRGLSLAMQQICKTAQKLSDLSRTVPFTKSKQIELFKYTGGRWLYNEEERGRFRLVPRLF